MRGVWGMSPLVRNLQRVEPEEAVCNNEWFLEIILAFIFGKNATLKS
jgi:hypothetical protein